MGHVRWTPEMDARLRGLRWEGLTWDAIAAAMELGRHPVVERGRKLGVVRRPPQMVVCEALDRPSLPAGHPDSWGLLTRGTLLEGSAYPYPVFL